MKHALALAAFSALTTLAFSLAAQPPGPGTKSAPHMGMQGGKHHGMCCSTNDTAGWAMMSRDERKAHREKMHNVKTYDECKTMHDEHMKQMESRAKEKGKTFAPPAQNMCDLMKQKGKLK